MRGQLCIRRGVDAGHHHSEVAVAAAGFIGLLLVCCWPLLLLFEEASVAAGGAGLTGVDNTALLTIALLGEECSDMGLAGDAAAAGLLLALLGGA